MSEAEVRALIGQYLPADQVDLAVLVVDCESNFDAAALNPNGYGGLFQHALSAWDDRAAAVGFAGEPWWNAEANIAAAVPLWTANAAYHWGNCYAWAEGQLGG